MIQIFLSLIATTNVPNQKLRIAIAKTREYRARLRRGNSILLVERQAVDVNEGSYSHSNQQKENSQNPS